FRARGMRTVVLNWAMCDPKSEEGFTHKTAMIPTDMPVLPALEKLCSDTVQLAAIYRRHAPLDGDLTFFLVDRDAVPVGYLRIDMREVSDADFAWLNCMLFECEDAL